MGSSHAAFLAGYMPKVMPMTIENIYFSYHEKDKKAIERLDIIGAGQISIKIKTPIDWLEYFDGYCYLSFNDKKGK